MVQQRIEIPRERPRERDTSQDVSAADLVNLRAFKVARIALSQNGTGNTYIFAWQNPESNAVIIAELIIYITTGSGAGSTMSIDVVADATSNSNTIFTTFNINQTGLFSNQILADTGGSGNERPHVVDENGGSNDWVTGYEAANASYANLVGFIYIFYTEI